MAKLLLLLGFAFVLTKAQNKTDMEVKKLFNDYTEWRFRENPEYATQAGDHKYNDVLRTVDLDNANASKATAEKLLGRALGLNWSSISRENDRVSLIVLVDMLRRYIDGYQWRYFAGLNPVNFMNSEISHPELLASAPLNTVGDFENYLARLRSIPQRIDNYIQMMRMSIEKNYTLHSVSVSRALNQIDAIVRVPTDKTSLYEPFISRLDSLTSPQDKNFYRQRGESVIDNLQLAFRNLRTFLVREYMPLTRHFFGLSGFSWGREFYAACLRWYLSYNATPEALHELGLQEVVRIETKMQEIMTKQGHNGSIGEYFDNLNTDERFHNYTEEELLEEFQSIVHDRIVPKLPLVFESVPMPNLQVLPSKADGSAASYSRGSLDGSEPSYLWVNTFRPRDKLTLNMTSVSLHEAVPGHHLQSMQALAADLPTFRRVPEEAPLSDVPFSFPAYQVFTEGWALYAEFLGEEMAVYQDDYERMGRYSSELLRACRLVVDTGLHYYGWDRERAIQYLQNYTSLSRGSAEVEVDRSLTIPGQACSCKVGEVKIRQARRRAEERLGDKFDLKKFHMLVLNNGAIPMSVLDDVVDRWVETAEVQTEAAPVCSAGASSVLFSVTALLATSFPALLCSV